MMGASIQRCKSVGGGNKVGRVSVSCDVVEKAF